jgi:hypothetical protein
MPLFGNMNAMSSLGELYTKCLDWYRGGSLEERVSKYQNITLENNGVTVSGTTQKVLNYSARMHNLIQLHKEAGLKDVTLQLRLNKPIQDLLVQIQTQQGEKHLPSRGILDCLSLKKDDRRFLKRLKELQAILDKSSLPSTRSNSLSSEDTSSLESAEDTSCPDPNLAEILKYQDLEYAVLRSLSKAKEVRSPEEKHRLRKEFTAAYLNLNSQLLVGKAYLESLDEKKYKNQLDSLRFFKTDTLKEEDLNAGEEIMNLYFLEADLLNACQDLEQAMEQGVGSSEAQLRLIHTFNEKHQIWDKATQNKQCSSPFFKYESNSGQRLSDMFRKIQKKEEELREDAGNHLNEKVAELMGLGTFSEKRAREFLVDGFGLLKEDIQDAINEEKNRTERFTEEVTKLQILLGIPEEKAKCLIADEEPYTIFSDGEEKTVLAYVPKKYFHSIASNLQYKEINESIALLTGLGIEEERAKTLLAMPGQDQTLGLRLRSHIRGVAADCKEAISYLLKQKKTSNVLSALSKISHESGVLNEKALQEVLELSKEQKKDSPPVQKGSWFFFS